MRRIVWMLLALVLAAGLVPQAALAKDNWSIEGAGYITSLSVSEDGSRLAIGSYGAKAFIYDGEGNEVYQVEARNIVTGAALLEDGRLIISSDDRHVYAYDQDGGLLWDSDMKRQVKAMSASRDGSVIALIIQRSNDIVFLDSETGEEAGAAAVGTVMRDIHVSTNGQWIAAATSDQYVYLFDKAGSLSAKFGAKNQIHGISVSNDGIVAIGTGNKEVELFNSEGESLGSIPARDVVTDVVVSDDGDLLGATDLSGNFYMFDMSGKRLWEMKAGSAGRSIALGKESTILYAGTEDGSIYKYDVSAAVGQAKKKAIVTTIIWLAAGAVVLAGLGILLAYMKKRNRLGIFKSIWKSKWIYLGLAPSFILLLTFLYYPAISGLYHSLYDWQPGGRTIFVGLDNFKRMLNDTFVIKGIGNLGLLIVTGLIKALIPPLIVAELIYHLRSKKLQYGFRTAFTASMVIPGVALLLIWQNLYDPNVGLINNFLDLVGLDSLMHGWLGDPKTAIWAIIFIGFPFIGILQLLVFYAGLLSIPGELIESAKIDGAGLMRIIRSIHLPLLAGQFKFLIILTLIGIVQDFNGILIVTGGGPMDSTYVPALQMYYAATKFNDLGYASALGVSMFLVILVITVINMKFIKSEND